MGLSGAGQVAGREAEDGLISFLRSQERVRNQEASVKAAERTLEITKEQNRQGVEAEGSRPVHRRQRIHRLRLRKRKDRPRQRHHRQNGKGNGLQTPPPAQSQALNLLIYINLSATLSP